MHVWKASGYANKLDSRTRNQFWKIENLWFSYDTSRTLVVYIKTFLLQSKSMHFGAYSLRSMVVRDVPRTDPFCPTVILFELMPDAAYFIESQISPVKKFESFCNLEQTCSNVFLFNLKPIFCYCAHWAASPSPNPIGAYSITLFWVLNHVLWCK